MRSVLFALAAVLAVPAQAAVTYQFTGTCTERLVMTLSNDDGWVPIRCATPDIQIKMPDDYVPGTSIYGGFDEPWQIEVHIADDVWGGSIFDRAGIEWSYSVTMPEIEGPGSLWLSFFVGTLTIGDGGSWRLISEGRWPTFYDVSGVDGRFSLAQQSQVPIPGTLALMGLGLLALRRR